MGSGARWGDERSIDGRRVLELADRRDLFRGDGDIRVVDVDLHGHRLVSPDGSCRDGDSGVDRVSRRSPEEVVEVYPWFIGEVPVGDAMKRLKGDVYNWWWVKRVWQTEQRTPRHASADRLEGVLSSFSHWSLAAFR